MEEEEQLESFAKVQLNHLLHSRNKMSRYFSDELVKLADPYYGSDEDSPRPRRKQKRAPRVAAPAACSSNELAEAESAQEAESNGDVMASMADFFALPPL